MPSPNIVVRDTDGLGELIEARAVEEHRSASAVVRSAVRAYLTGSDDGEALDHAVRRAQALEAKLDRALADLAAVRGAVTAAAGVHGAAEDRFAREAAFTEALEAATAEHPVTTAQLIALSGWSRQWVTALLTFLVREGYVTRPRKGLNMHVPGTDLGEGIRRARELAPGGSARIASDRRKARDSSPPAPAPPVPAGEAEGGAEGNSAATRGEASRNARTERPAARKRDDGDAALDAVLAAADEDMLTAIDRRLARARSAAEAVGAPLFAASDLPRPGAAVFQPPGEGKVTIAVPEVPDHSGKKARQHALNCKCGVCQPKAVKR